MGIGRIKSRMSVSVNEEIQASLKALLRDEGESTADGCGVSGTDVVEERTGERGARLFSLFS